MTDYVSRAGAKLDFALTHFGIDPTNLVCADLGCSTGGFTDCLLQHHAAKVYAVDTGYGVLAWKLRTNPQVVVMERTNALHVLLPEAVDLVTIDVGWTPQHLILPHAKSLLKPGGRIISLLKPHYESHTAHLAPHQADQILHRTLTQLTPLGFSRLEFVVSPIRGEKAGNQEYLLMLTPP